VLSHHTGKTPAQVEKDSDRDYYMSAVEAKEYGLVDHVFSSIREAKEVTAAVASAA
jgi:ATP-dependent Clp protease, protease subunit